jgi:PRTRC genetic system protein C
MAIAINEVTYHYSYNGISLGAAIPGYSHKQMRDLHSARFPELISAEVRVGERDPATNVCVVEFARAVGTKG